jgi:hypothetical protein
MMKKFITRIGLFILALYGLSLVVSILYTVLFSSCVSDWSKENWVLMRRGDTLDYATLGSSRVLHTINVPLLNTLTGKKGINIATSGSSYADNYALLHQYLKNNIVKTLVLNIDEFCLNSSKHYSYPFKDYQYMPYFFEDTMHEVYRDHLPLWKCFMYNAIPLSRYVEYNTHYNVGGLVWLNAKDEKSIYDTTSGTQLLYDLAYKKIDRKDTIGIHSKQFIVDQRDLHYFYKVIALCRVKKIKLILITPPLYTKGLYASENRKAIVSYINKMAEEEQLDYVDFDSLTQIQNILYFRDLTHTNSAGTNVYTHYLAKRLINSL